MNSPVVRLQNYIRNLNALVQQGQGDLDRKNCQVRNVITEISGKKCLIRVNLVVETYQLKMVKYRRQFP